MAVKMESISSVELQEMNCKKTKLHKNAPRNIVNILFVFKKFT